MASRSRLTQAERRQRNLKRKWDDVDRSWQRYARCGVCRRTYCSNNYPDHKPRHTRVRGVPVCAQCWYHPEIDFLVWCMLQVPEDHKKRLKHKKRTHLGGPRP